MAYARIVTIKKGTVIRCVNFDDGQHTDSVDLIATTLNSIICEELNILKVEVDYTGCDNSQTVEGYDPHE